MSRTIKRVTVPALVIWTATVGLLVALHFLAMRLPMLATRPFTDITVLVTLGGTFWAQSLMRPVPFKDVLPSRSNGVFANIVYAANLPIGVMGIFSLLYLIGFLGPEKPMVTALALSNLAVMFLVQCLILSIPVRSLDG